MLLKGATADEADLIGRTWRCRSRLRLARGRGRGWDCVVEFGSELAFLGGGFHLETLELEACKGEEAREKSIGSDDERDEKEPSWTG